MDETEGEVEEMIEKLNGQHKILEEILSEQKSAKNTLAFVKLAGTFKERKDTYYVGIVISKDLNEIERTIGYTVDYTKRTHSDSYLVVVVILPKVLQSSFRENQFKLNVSVQFDKRRISRTVSLDVTKFIIIPWVDYTINSELNVRFFGKIRGKNVVYRIPKMFLNLTYFLRPQNEEKDKKCETCKEKLFQISKQYDQSSKICFKPNLHRYSMIVHDDFKFTDIPQRAFPGHLAKSLFEHENSTTFKILRNLSSEVEIVKKNNLIEIKSDIDNLWVLKKFLVEEKYIHKELEILAMKEFSNRHDEMDINNINEVYKFLRSIWNVVINYR